MADNFAITGVAGFIARRHLNAIRNTGNRLIAAVDPHDSVGILDQYGFDVKFFTEIERFDRHLEKLRRGPEASRVRFVSICSPNFLHDAHCRLALRIGANAICEKPLVINPWNLDALKELEQEVGCRVYTILQLRVHPKLMELKNKLLSELPNRQHDVCLSYITGRGAWYRVSWKGSAEKSGGIAVNIGIHFFDLLLWLFGRIQTYRLHYSDEKRMAGFLELEHARVKWFLSLDASDLPPDAITQGRSSYRSLVIDGEETEFTDVSTDLHTLVYQEILAGRGFGIEDASPSIELAYRIRSSTPEQAGSDIHPFLKKA